MDGTEIKRWRQKLGWTQGQAADHLGISRGTLLDYERGVRRSDGRPAPIPKAIELACHTLERGVTAYGAGADYRNRADDRPYVEWAAKQFARPTSELEAQGRRLFAEVWHSYPYAMIAPPEWDDPARSQEIIKRAHDHGIECEWRFLPIAKEPQKGWSLVVRVIVTLTIDDLMFFKMWLKAPIELQGPMR